MMQHIFTANLPFRSERIHLYLLSLWLLQKFLGEDFHQETIFLVYSRAEEPTFNDQEKEKFVLFVRAFCEHLVPHVKSCLEQLYPVSQLSSTFGISAIEICKIVSNDTSTFVVVYLINDYIIVLKI